MILRNQTIDIFRLFAIFSVIILHVNYGTLNDEIVRTLRVYSRWAVPFFFIVSGYFFQKRYDVNPEGTFLAMLRNLISIFIVANIIFLVEKLVREPWNFQKIFNNKVFIEGTSFHLWFIGSMILGYLVLWFFLSKNLLKSLMIFALTVMLFILIADAYSRFFGININSEFLRNLIAIPCLTLGYFSAKYNIAENKFTLITAAVAAVGGMFFQFFEGLLIFKNTGYKMHHLQFLIGTMIFAYGMFALSIKAAGTRETLLSKLGREYSLLIYLYHPLINIFIFDLLFRVFGFWQAIPWFSPVISFVFTTIFLVLLNKIWPRLFRLLSGR